MASVRYDIKGFGDKLKQRKLREKPASGTEYDFEWVLRKLAHQHHKITNVPILLLDIAFFQE